MAGPRQRHGLRRQQVIRLDPFLLDPHQAHCARERLDRVNLLLQRLGHLGTLGLVLGMQRQAFVRATQVEKHQRGRRLLLVGKPPERFHPAVQRSGGKPIRAGQFGDRIKATVRQVESVNQQPFRHARAEPTPRRGSRDGKIGHAWPQGSRIRVTRLPPVCWKVPVVRSPSSISASFSCNWATVQV